MKAVSFYETSVNIYQETRDISEYLDLQFFLPDRHLPFIVNK
jgi:hypothetical protein